MSRAKVSYWKFAEREGETEAALSHRHLWDPCALKKKKKRKIAGGANRGLRNREPSLPGSRIIKLTAHARIKRRVRMSNISVPGRNPDWFSRGLLTGGGA